MRVLAVLLVAAVDTVPERERERVSLARPIDMDNVTEKG